MSRIKETSRNSTKMQRGEHEIFLDKAGSVMGTENWRVGESNGDAHLTTLSSLQLLCFLSSDMLWALLTLPLFTASTALPRVQA